MNHTDEWFIHNKANGETEMKKETSSIEKDIEKILNCENLDKLSRIWTNPRSAEV